MSLQVLLSPAKKLNFDAEIPAIDYAQPLLWDKTVQLGKVLKKLSVKKIADLMKLSLDLSQLNYQRYQDFENEQTAAISKPAMFVFNGEVYTGLQAQDFNEKELQFANHHLRILSGLYGVLKPLDFMQPYRLEMGTKLANGKNKNLYEFWGNEIHNHLKSDLAPNDTIINLASNEYFKAAKGKNFKNTIITPLFKDFKNGDYKTIMVFAKKSRGAMAHYIVKNKITDPEDLKGFDVDGYSFNDQLSSELEWVFTR